MTDFLEDVGDPEHRAVPGGFECEVCGATRQTPLGMQRHREEHRRRQRARERTRTNSSAHGDGGGS